MLQAIDLPIRCIGILTFVTNFSVPEISRGTDTLGFTRKGTSAHVTLVSS